MAITKVYLLSVPLEKDCAHTLWFANESQQRTYFQNNVQAQYSDFTYQRKDNIIRIPAQIDTLWEKGINYVMYQNTAYNDKWFYAFITDMQYMNDGRTDLTIETDCMQTWFFERRILPCFVEREHAASDEVGEHTLEEGLELGEYVSNRHTKANYGGAIYEDSVIVVGVTETPEGEKFGGFYDGIYSGIRYYGFTNYDIATHNALEKFIEGYDEGKADAIACMFMAPKKLASPKEDHILVSSNLVSWHYINYTGSPTDGLEELYDNISMTTGSLNGYVPKNKKLLSFPYRYLLVANNAGTSVPLKYEKFYTISDSGEKIPISPEFRIEGCLTPGCSVRMVPLHYNGIDRNDEEGINLGKYPIINWTSDVYTNWLTQNGVNIGLQIASGVGQIVTGAVVAAGTGGLGGVVGGGTIVGGVTTIANTLAQIHQQSFAPPQARGNINSGDVSTASDQNDFHFYDMTIKGEYALILDEYFNMYGYKCNRVKIPEDNHRKSYWFVKTIAANITGEIPQADLQKIKDCYDRGITFWRSTVSFKWYGDAENGYADNAIV